MKKQSIYFLVFLLFLNHNSFSQSEVKRIDIEKGIRNVQNIQLSTLASDIQYIPLETNSKCLLGDSPRIQLTENEIFVATAMEHIFRFNREGKYLNEIGKIGRGPGECVRMINYILNDKERKVIVNDAPFGNKIVTYDFEGNFIDKFNVKISSMVIEPFLDNNILLQNMYYTRLVKGEKINEIEIYSSRGKKINSFPSSADPSKKYGMSFIPPVGYNFQNTFHYKVAESDTLYTIPDIKTKTPKYIFDMGNKRRAEEADEFKDLKIKNTVAIMDLWETKSYLFFTCTGNENRQSVLYNKPGNSASNVIWKNKPGLEDDIAGGLPFWPYLFTDSNNEKLLIDFVFPHELLAHTKSEYFREKCKTSDKAKALKELCGKINDSDNIIIRIVTLK